MALRRPPTRIELKADDVEEYDKVSLKFFPTRALCRICESGSGGVSKSKVSKYYCVHVVWLFCIIFVAYNVNTANALKFISIFQIMKERRLLAEQQAMREENNTDNSQQHHQQPDGSALLGASPSSFASKKPTAAERIGYRRPR